MSSLEKQLLAACLARPVEDRAAYLAAHCDDPEVRARVMTLLEVSEGVDESPTLDSPPPREDRAPPPDRIGPYRIVQVLGQGGMGVVYEAEQSEPVRRRVALKIVKLGMDTRQVVARFEAERQALAVMEHPFISKVLDGGATPEGRPYFVMELVRGVALPDFCDQQGLSARERLGLYLRVCQAVQHAHQKGVIHRDLKPSNILVSLDGDEAVPRVIDFGIAKAVGPPLTDSSVVTLHGQAIGTPAYMSPEQAGALGLDVDTRTDVYSLGVILYELLVGALPMDPRELGVHEFMARLARLETDHPTPSSRLGTLVDQGSVPSRRSASEAASLQRQLKGDLDWIIMKAIEKNRARRYPTVSALADDVRRFLAHETVSARPPTAVYRFSRFVRRHRVGVAAASVALVAVLFGAIGASVGLVRATRAEADARREAATSREVADFLVRLFEISDPGESRGGSVTARELLTAGANTIETELGDQPRVKARLLATLSRVHRTLGLYDEAASLGEQSLTAHDASPVSTDAERAEALSALGGAYSRLGRYEEAVQVLEEALSLRRKAAGETSLEATRSLHDLGVVFWMLDRQEEARPLLEESLRIREGHYGPDHVEVARAVRALAFVVADTDGDQQALPLYERALGIYERHHGEDHPVVADTLDSVGLTLVGLERYEAARPYHDRALVIRGRVLGESHPVVAYSMLNLGRLHVAEGRPAEAVPYFERGVAIREAALGPEHPRTADMLESAARCHAVMGEADRAEELFERALGIYEEAYGPEHADTFFTRRNLAMFHALEGHRDEALRHLRLASESHRPAEMKLDDPGFASLRGDDEFQELVEEVNDQLVARASAELPAAAGSS